MLCASRGIGVDGGHLLEQHVEPGVAPVRLEVGAVARRDDCDRVVSGLDATGARVQHVALRFVQHGGEDLILAFEPRVEAADGALGLGCDIHEARVDVTIPFEDGARRRDEGVPGALAPGRLGLCPQLGVVDERRNSPPASVMPDMPTA